MKPDQAQVFPRGFSVVVPVYNSAGMLPELTARLVPVLAALDTPHEIILVNDGSQDASWEVVQHLAAGHACVRGICMMRNYGQHNALLAGIRAARFDTILTMDDDLQHPPEELPKLIATFRKGYDVVYAIPVKMRHGLLRDLASLITKLTLQGAMGVEAARTVSAQRAFRTRLRGAFANFNGSFVNIDVLLTWGATTFGAVHLEHLPRRAGESNYTVRKLFRHAVNMMTGFSVLPLQIASLLGFACSFFGVAVLLYVLAGYFTMGSPVAGFPFLASIIAIFSGVQLFALGIIGEYLARMHFRIMDRPPYAVRETTPHESEPG